MGSLCAVGECYKATMTDGGFSITYVYITEAATSDPALQSPFACYT